VCLACRSVCDGTDFLSVCDDTDCFVCMHGLLCDDARIGIFPSLHQMHAWIVSILFPFAWIVSFSNPCIKCMHGLFRLHASDILSAPCSLFLGQVLKCFRLMLWATGSLKLSAAVCVQDLTFLRKMTKNGAGPPCLSYALSSLKRSGHALVMSAPKKMGGGQACPSLDCPARLVGACVYWDKYILFQLFLPLQFS